MKNKLFLFLGAIAAFASSSLVTYKLMNPYPRYVGLYGKNMLRELYEDNSVEMNWSVFE